MNITLVSQYYWPESFGAGVWTTELAEWLQLRGHNVSVITGLPNHPDGVIFPEYRGEMYKSESHNGVRVVRTWLYARPRTSRFWQRMLSQASFSMTLLLGMFSIPRPDVVWFASPPLPGCISAWLLARIHGAALVMNISDLEPERSIALGLIQNRHLVRILRFIECFCYAHADRICVLSQGTKESLVAKGVSSASVSVTANWADGNLIRPMSLKDSLREELGIGESEFVVLYSGNMGYTMSDLEGVVEAARRLSGRDDIRFVLAGDGVRREKIEALAAGLKQVLFLPIQPRDRYPRLLATANLCLVVLNREGTYTSVPSKTYSIMAAGKPLLAICESSNDVARVIREAECGAQVLPGDIDSLVDAIRHYCDNLLLVEVQGGRARKYFEQHYSQSIGMAAYESVFAEICGRPHGTVALADTPQP